MPDQITATAAAHAVFSSPAGPLAGLDADPGAPAPTLLMLPGYTGSKEDFVPLLDPLAAAGIRAVAIDQLGQYQSAPAGAPRPLTDYQPVALGALAAGLVRELTARGPVVLLGHSYGGLVARQAILQGAPVAGLMLLCSGPAAFRDGNRFDALHSVQALLEQAGTTGVYDAGLRAAGLDPEHLNPVQAFMRTRFVETSPEALLGAGQALLTEPDLVDQLAVALADRPVAVVSGKNDDAWPHADQADMATRLGTELVLVPGAAHSPAVENPDALLALLVPLIREWTGR